MNDNKYCCFYVSDIHLITMLLPYINEKTKENFEFVTMFESDISKSAEKVIESLSIKRREKQKFLKIGWKPFDENITNFENKIILAMGSDKHIREINFKFEKEKVIIINCFEVFQAEKNIDEIVSSHSKLINSKGENDISQIFTQSTKKNNKKITIIE